MKTYRLGSLGSLDSLVVHEEARRPLAPGEVRIQMHAVSLNYRDLLLILNLYPMGNKDNLVPLSDGAGEVLEVASDVTQFTVGQRVVANFNGAWIDGPAAPGYFDKALGGACDGTLAEEIILPDSGILPFPDHLSYDEAAAHGCASITAWSSLVGGRPLLAGQTLLVQGTGGVSMFGLQYAKAAGARVIATTSSAAKAEKLRELGADEVIDYVKEPEWQNVVRHLTDGRGVDRVIEVGGPGTIQRSVAATGIGGHIAVVGFSGGAEGSLSPLALLGNGITLEGIAVGSRRHFYDSLRLTAQAKLHPVIDGEIFSFDRARDAFQYMIDRKHFGKIVIRIKV